MKLLVKIIFNTGDLETLLEYSEFLHIEVTSTYSSCCVSIYENTVFIAISQPSSSTDGHIRNIIIKLNILNKDDATYGPTIDTLFDKQSFIFPNEYKKTSTSRDISCEVAVEQTTNNSRLLCVYEDIGSSNKIVYLSSINFNSENFENTIVIAQTPYEFGFRLYKLDNYYLRLVLRTGVYDINLNSNFEIISKNVDSNFRKYNSYWNLFTYHNNVIVTYLVGNYINYNGDLVLCHDMRIYTPDKDDYYIIFIYKNLNLGNIKMYNYYNDTLDYFTLVYQSSAIINYVTFQGNKEIYNIKSNSYVLRVKSNEEIDFDVSTLIESSVNFGKLYIGESVTMYSSNKSETVTKRYIYESITFPMDKDTQKMTLEASQNIWYSFSLAFVDINEDYGRAFYLPNAKLSIRTCAFQCGSCSTDYYICDTCRDSNYAKKYGSNDTNCYPIDQLLEGYIYDPDTQYFQECYFRCKFCYLNSYSSSLTSHNCLSCIDGYTYSYKYLGNCYQNVETEENIIVSSISDNSFIAYSSCSTSLSNPYKISSTKECVTSCPETIPYKSYTCKEVNFTEQEYGVTLSSHCIGTQLNPPKYYLGNVCYESCPKNSQSVESTNECKCSNAWHKDSTTQEIECYEGDYCKYEGYKYYLSDTKECTTSCPSGYYQFNFQCYSDGCPSDTTLTDSNTYKCESKYNFCYVSENYQNVCSNEKDTTYIYNFDNTKQYLKSCSESLTYTTSESKTYLYNGICYLNCPENTSNNEEKNICDCNFFGYYSETDENDYICYSEEEKCSDKIPVNDLKICLDTIDDCISKNYKIFNNECYSVNCPENSEIKSSSSNYCYCSNYFYKNDNILECFNSSITSCEQNGYEYSNPLTLECFDSLDDCYSKSNTYYFNKYCYKDTCSDYIALSSISNETVRNDFISNLNIEDEYLNRICVCNIFNTNIKWDFTVSEGVYTQECVTECKEEYEPNTISSLCIESCLSYKHYMFNDECYYE